MNRTNELLQTAQLQAPAQTRRSGGAGGGQRTQESGRADFHKLLRGRAEAGGTKTTERPEPGEDADEQPRDKTLREVTAAMAMLMAQAPPQIQTAELLPEETQLQTIAPAELTAIPQTGDETALSGNPVRAELQGAEIPTAAKPENSAGQGAVASQATWRLEASQNAETAQSTQKPQAPQTLQDARLSQPSETLAETRTQAGGAGAEARSGSENPNHMSGDSETLRPENVGAGAPQPLFRQVETVPVKVGETPAADTTSPDLDKQLAVRLGAALKDGAQQVKLRLTPDNLGTLTIDLTRTRDGALQVVFHTTTEKAADLLNRHAETLSALLQSNSQSTVQVEVRRQEEAQQFQQQNQQNQQHEQGRRQQEHRRQSGEDFLQQLRLGLVTLDGQVS